MNCFSLTYMHTLHLVAICTLRMPFTSIFSDSRRTHVDKKCYSYFPLSQSKNSTMRVLIKFSYYFSYTFVIIFMCMLQIAKAKLALMC